MEVMEEAMEPFSQSLSMFLLDARLRPGMDSMEHTEPALEDTSVINHQSPVDQRHPSVTYIQCPWAWTLQALTSETPPLRR